MPILNDLLDSLEGDAPIQDILLGVHWTSVCSRRCGMAATMGCSSVHGEITLNGAGKLHERSARELAAYALSQHPLEISVGMAAINSLILVDETKVVEANALDILARLGKDKRVVLVGHFPFVPMLRKAVGTLQVLEQVPIEDDFPADAAPALIPEADVVAITASAFLNGTIEELLNLCSPSSEVMVLGPTAPFSPILFDYGATLIAGTEIAEKDAAFQSIAQGAAFRQVSGTRLLVMAKTAIPPA